MHSSGQNIDLLKDLEIVKELSKTKLSTVYHARKEDVDYALKSVSTSDQHSVNNIEKELYLYENFDDHPNILKCFGYARTQSHIYVLLEYASGGDMWESYMKSSVLKRKKCGLKSKKVESRLAKHTYQIIDALKFIHSHGIVHADLKVENVLLDADDNVKLCDFGLSFIDNGEFPFEHARKVCGTVSCLAPEILDTYSLQGKEGHYPEASADIWALGVLLYEVYYHRTPFVTPKKEKEINSPEEGLDSSKLYELLHSSPKYFKGTPVEFESLLCRIFRTDPYLRASLSEIQRSKWIKKNYLEPYVEKMLSDEDD